MKVKYNLNDDKLVQLCSYDHARGLQLLHDSR